MSAALSQLVRDWQLDPAIVFLLVLTVGAYLLALRRVRRWPARRTAAFLAGIATLALSLLSGLDALADRLQAAHMLQHLLLLAVAPPLLLAGAPLALALRALPTVPRHALARALAGRTARTLTHPVLALVLFSAVVAGTHVPGFYDAALRHPLVHALEHALYLWTALLLWLPVVDVVPRAHPLSPLTRMLLVLAAMPAMIAVGVWLSSAARVVYPPYAHPDAGYGTTPLADQRLAGMLMWIGGSAAGGALALWLGWRAAAQEEARQLARERAQDAAAAAGTVRAPIGGGAA